MIFGIILPLLVLSQDDFSEEDYKRAKMISCVNIIQTTAKKDQTTYDLMAMQHGYDSNDLKNKIIADMLEHCFYNMPNEEAVRISLLRDEYIVEEKIKPFFMVEYATYSSPDADLEVSEAQKTLIADFLYTAKAIGADHQEYQHEAAWQIEVSIMRYVYILVVIVGFVGFIYCLISRLGKKTPAQQRKEAKGKKNK